MTVSSPGSSRFTARHLLLAGLIAAALGAGAYRLYSPSGHSATPAAGPSTYPDNETRVDLSRSKPAAQALSPSDELAAAQQEKDPERIRAALQAWARLAPDAAAKWVVAQPLSQRLVNGSVVLIALADRPADAVRVADYFCKEDPSYVREHGDSLVAVLTAAGEFDRAVNFASLGGPERAEWVSRAFTSWTELAPSDAARAALTFEGDDAVAIVFATWAARNRTAAARYTSGANDLVTAQRNALLALAQSGTGR